MNNKTESITISSHLGDITGIKESNIFSFKGIPYGADTSGKNRWRSPQEPESWSEPFDASSFGPQCPQFIFRLKYLGKHAGVVKLFNKLLSS
mgnify:CR=1 FL=1